MNYEIIGKEDGMVTIRCSEEECRQIQEFIDRRRQMQVAQRPVLKNVIPVMLNKFTKWLDSLKASIHPVARDIVDKIKKIRKGRQNMSIKDLRQFCEEDDIKEYWLRFLYEGHAERSISRMKTTTNKRIYQEQINALLQEIQNPRVSGKPYKNFISQRNTPIIDDALLTNENSMMDDTPLKNEYFSYTTDFLNESVYYCSQSHSQTSNFDL